MSGARWTRFERIGVLGVASLALAACGADSTPAAERQPLEVVEPPAAEGRAARDTSEVTPTAATAPPAAADRPVPAVDAIATEIAPTPARQDLDQPAIWPAPDVVFATPEEAAADFVSRRAHLGR